MNRSEYLLTVLGEEGAEVAHRVSKALRFGLDEVQPAQPDTNGERIRFEVYDVISTYLIAAAENDALPPLHLDAEIIDQIAATKKAKIERFMAISVEQGTLAPCGTRPKGQDGEAGLVRSTSDAVTPKAAGAQPLPGDPNAKG